MDATEAAIAQVASARKQRGRPVVKHRQPSPDAIVEKPRVAVESGDLEDTGRPARVPFGGFSYKLEVKNKDPNYYYYWFKDEGDMVKRALRAGYEFVTERDATGGEFLTNQDVLGGNQSLTDRYEITGGKDEFGRHFNMVLMRQPMEYHLADVAAEQANIDTIDTAINRQSFQNTSIANKYGEINMTRVKE